MSLAIVNARASLGLEAPPVVVEVHITGGLPRFSIVGLPETAVKESKDRVRSALLNGQFDFPRRHITVNLAPADLPKDGGRFDLAIAVGILAATAQAPTDSLVRYEFVGELGLTGALRPVGSTLTASLGARAAGRSLVLPLEDAPEAALARDACVLPARTLLDVCAHLRGRETLTPHEAPPLESKAADCGDLSEVIGQHRAKRALEIAAAGAHNLLFMGPPGSGKTMLASRLPGILPPMEETEALESAAVRSVSTLAFTAELWGQRPFRAPHHTASGVALVGGGSRPRPGEASLAHNGVLFLDELPEFDRRVLEVLREPLESGRITISRAARQAEFPARFQLVAAMNPCPCGHLGDAGSSCRCTADQVQRYRGRISGPLLDRIDLHVEVPRQLRNAPSRQNRHGPMSARVAERVHQARCRQLARGGTINAWLNPAEIASYCRLGGSEERLLDAAVRRFGLSQRGRHRVLKVARTVADLAQSSEITSEHLSEAIGFRLLDRNAAES